jgi:peptidyl-prolyl cis-trans isomerase C
MRKMSASTLTLCLLLAPGILSAAIACSGSAEEPGKPVEKGSTGQEPAPPQPSQPQAPAQEQTAVDPEKFPDVVARVNGEEVKKSDLLMRAKAIRARTPGVAESQQFYRELLNQMVGAKLLVSESQTQGLGASDAEVDAQFTALKGRFPDEASFTQALGAEGLNAETLKRDMKQNLTIQKLVEKEIAGQISITEEAQRKFYQENLDRLQQPERVRVSHILVQVGEGDSAEAKADKRKKADSLLVRIKTGEDFAKLAGESSDDPGSKSKGGELPWVSAGDTVPAFEKAAFALEPGGLSEVVESDYGFHIIKLHEKKAASTVPFETVKGEITQFLTQREIQERLEQRVEQLRATAKVEILI